MLETTDGVGILGYAGLGATALGTEAADWMSAVLRGRNLPFEQSLGVLAEAMKQQLPAHMRVIPGPGGPVHNLFATALVGGEPRLYEIDLVFSPDRRQCWFRHTRHFVDRPSLPKPKTPRFAAAGSGALQLAKDRLWMRAFLRLIRASDTQKLTPDDVADHLAKLNSAVHALDPSVGPRCVVAWRNRKEGVHRGGGSLQYYTGITREDGPMLPTIGCGMDITALIKSQMPRMMETMAAMLAGKMPPEPDKDAINAQVARLPSSPDENLR